MCSHEPIRKFFCGAFLQKSDLLRRSASAFLFLSFSLRLLCQKKAEFRIVPYKTAVTLHKDTQAVNPLFLFAKRGTKRKSSQKEKCRLGSFAHCGERQGLTSPLTCAHWRGGSDGFVRTYPSPLNINLSVTLCKKGA